MALFFSLLSCKPTQTNFSFVLNPEGIETKDLGAVMRFLEEASDRIPESMKQGLNRKVEVHFIPLDSQSEILAPCGDDEAAGTSQHIFGSTDRLWFESRRGTHAIDLHSAFLPIIAAGEAASKTYPCGHRNLYRLAMATLIHEIGHVYDFANFRRSDETHQIEKCNQEAKRPGGHLVEYRTASCQELVYRTRTVSGRRDYLRLMGWTKPVGPFGADVPKNHLKLRSPDPYEFADITESFAVNLEYFLMDPEFACRRPAVHSYLTSHFGIDPFPERSCRPNSTVFLSGWGIPMSIDPARIYQVHFLLAGKGEAMMSRWGHAMLRLVVCSPERPRVDADCLKDVSSHLVISFRANISDLVVSSFRGLMGSYPSRLFVYPLSEIVDEYTRRETRKMVSLPLALTEEQKTFLVYRILELYWGYSGSYYFISNNCATEAADLLRVVLPGDHLFQTASFVSPLGMFDELVDEKMIDMTLVANREEARKSGYYFPSNQESLASAFKIISDSMSTRSFSEIRSYLDETDAAARRALYLSLQPADHPKDRKLVAAFFLLESQVKRELEKGIADHSVAFLTEGQSQSPEMLKLLERYRSPRLQMDPWTLLSEFGNPNEVRRYGVAMENEWVPLAEISARRREFAQLMKDFYALAADELKDETKELDAVKGNQLFFAEELKGAAL